MPPARARPPAPRSSSPPQEAAPEQRTHTAGKGGIISRIAAAMSPRVCKVVALSAPTERERTQWYFQRYVNHLPAAGEIVLFDRSWYNRAGVEKVMGFCSPEEYEAFMNDVPSFERMLVDNAKIVLVKYWLDVSDHEQEVRFEGRLHRSWKRWKLSPMDLYARSKWTEYAIARDEMLRRTDHPWAPWWVIPSDDKKISRLNTISDLLSRVKCGRPCLCCLCGAHSGPGRRSRVAAAGTRACRRRRLRCRRGTLSPRRASSMCTHRPASGVWCRRYTSRRIWRCLPRSWIRRATTMPGRRCMCTITRCAA